MAKNKEIQNLLSRLVSIESLSSKEKKLSNYIAEWCEEENIPFQNIDGNILITLGSEKKKKHLLLNAHMDVVPGDNWNNSLFSEQKPFEPKIHQDRMYGRGTADTKSGLAAMLLTARGLINNYILLSKLEGKVSFLFSRAEEGEGAFNGVRKILGEKMITGPTAAIIAEPSNLEVLLGSGGLFNFSLEGTSENKNFSFLNQNVDFALLKKSALSIKNSLPAIDRVLLFSLILESTFFKTGARVSNIECSSTGFSFRPERLTVELSENPSDSFLFSWADEVDPSGKLLFETNSSSLSGHPAYAHYDSSVMQIISNVFGDKYLPFNEPLFDALNLMIFRSKQKLRKNLSKTEVLFAPLPNIEFTSLKLKEKRWLLNTSCRTSPEISNDVINKFISQLFSQLTITSSPYRQAICTDMEEDIVKISAKVIKDYYPDIYPFAVQLGASDGQIMRDVYPFLPLILLSSGSGVMIGEGSDGKAPKYLSTSHQPSEFVDLNQLDILPEIYLQIIVDYLK